MVVFRESPYSDLIKHSSVDDWTVKGKHASFNKVSKLGDTIKLLLMEMVKGYYVDIIIDGREVDRVYIEYRDYERTQRLTDHAVAHRLIKIFKIE